MNFVAFMEVLSRELSQQGRMGTRLSYISTCRSVSSFAKNTSINLKEVFSKEFLYRYQHYLLYKGCCYNTVSSYMRVLRSVRNKAVKRGLIHTDSDLFDHVYTGSEPTQKRAISPKTILALHSADLSAYPLLKLSRDLFMLSFHLQGMSFVDLAHLRKADLKGNMIIYHRRKTGGLIAVPILAPARDLLNRYRNKDKSSPYLLSILSCADSKLKIQYSSVLRTYNRRLKKLSEVLGLSENITSYVSRHSWATAAYHIGVPTTLIGEALGHRTEEVTRVYLASFDTKMLAYANKKVLNSLFKMRTLNNKNVRLLGGDGHKVKRRSKFDG
ncbi:site-specific integrase [Bacteroides sp. 51]|uniref:site-specific integrase n=1 Tax=Bacteroides sp. 51 TaxID=2302938 RepID=UPI0013D62742|nr:site-specific integrase [Bacteroides sp. 51]NDV84358.1 hypothetical protein [Bacteroides sp. 51]